MKKCLILKKEEECTLPEDDNALMNFKLTDFEDNPEKPKACDVEKVKDEIEEKLIKDLVYDEYDSINKGGFERQFFSNPNTRAANDQKELGEWLYGDMGKCKSKSVLGFDVNREECVQGFDNKYHERYDQYHL